MERVLDTLYPESLEAKALEAGGCEHIQVPGFEIMGTWQLFLPFDHWDVHPGRLTGCWVLGHPGGLRADQLHWGRFLGPSVGLGGQTCYRSKPEQRISESGTAPRTLGEMPATLPSLSRELPYPNQTSGGVLVQRGSIYRPSFCLYPCFQNPWC